MPAKTNIRIINRQIDDPIALEGFRKQLQALDNTLQNATLGRSRIEGQGDNPESRRNYNDEFGYPETQDITLADYWQLYERNGIARRVVDILPAHSWKVRPMVHEDDDPDNITPFEQAVTDLSRSLTGESFYADDRSDLIWDYAARLDKIAGLGGYGVLLIGVGGPDGENLEEPLIFSPSAKTSRELIFLRAFSEIHAPITDWETNANDRRLGLPTFYNLSFGDAEAPTVSADSSIRPTVGSKRVHWTRVLHYTHPVLSNEIRHTPALLPSYNRLLDLGKLYGGSAEMYFRGGLPGLSFETHPSLGGDVEIDIDALREMAEFYQNGLQRILATTGMSVNSLAPQVADPTAQVSVQLQAVAIERDCPMRILMGSERGELASSQDRRYWDDILSGRRENHLTPRLAAPLYNRFILLGLLPMPGDDGFLVTWPEIETLSPLEKADQAVKITQAIVTYVNGDGVTMLPVAHFLTLVLGFSHNDTKEIVDVLAADDLEEHLRDKAVAAIVDPEADIELAGSVAGDVT